MAKDPLVVHRHHRERGNPSAVARSDRSNRVSCGSGRPSPTAKAAEVTASTEPTPFAISRRMITTSRCSTIRFISRPLVSESTARGFRRTSRSTSAHMPPRWSQHADRSICVSYRVCVEDPHSPGLYARLDGTDWPLRIGFMAEPQEVPPPQLSGRRHAPRRARRQLKRALPTRNGRYRAPGLANDTR